MRWGRQLVRIVAIVAALATTLVADEAAVAPFALAVVRQDGTLLPFTTWDGTRFVNAWPVPAKAVDTPITLDAIPKRWWQKLPPVTTWHLWQLDSASSEVQATAPTWLPAHCLQAVGLRTNMKLAGPPPPPTVQPYPKVGVASSRRLEFQPIAIVDVKGPVSTALEATLLPGFEQAEEAEVKRWLTNGWRHPYEVEARRRVPLTVEALYRTPIEGGSFLYFYEAVKRYAPRPGEAISNPDPAAKACEVATFTRGWFRTGLTDAKITVGESETVLTGCDYQSVDVMFPLASLKQGGRTLWIVQLSGWGRESYAILDPLRDRGMATLTQTSGGNCPED